MAVEGAGTAPSLPYHEPAIVTILVQCSFLLLLNVINAAFDRLIYCGLLGQVLVGIAWGAPGAEWLAIEVQKVIVQLGYLGLLLLVYEGGLSTSFKSLKANLLLSSAVAVTGISVPIALSYTLQGLLGATPLQAFAAGAALCSTSLGTTFTVLASSGLSSSRLGVVLTSAAMMDDVVGLVMVQVISNLGRGDIGAITVVRPILVSIAFAFVVPVACRFLVKPLTLSLNQYLQTHPDSSVSKIFVFRQTAFTVHTALLLALVTGASYAGTSNLFAAYMAGAAISWWDSEVPHVVPTREGSVKEKTSATSPNRKESAFTAQAGGGPSVQDEISSPSNSRNSREANRSTTVESKDKSTGEQTSGSAIYARYYQQVVARILQPLFFASIGFSIPITRMFKGSIVWRGIVYTILMSFAKLVCGIWLVRFPLAPFKDALRMLLSKTRLPAIPHLWGKSTQARAGTSLGRNHVERQPPQQDAPPSDASHDHTSNANKPVSLHPPVILAFAMTARGEIGFLISAVAESNRVFSSPSSFQSSESDIFLVVTWAVVLCTILGPLGVGLCVRRVKKLERRRDRAQEGAGRNVLGVWGVE